MWRGTHPAALAVTVACIHPVSHPSAATLGADTCPLHAPLPICHPGALKGLLTHPRAATMGAARSPVSCHSTPR